MVGTELQIVFGDDGDEAGTLDVPTAPPGERFRFEVSTQGRMRRAPRRLMVDFEDDRIAVREANGALLWLRTPEELVFREDGKLVTVQPDAGALLPFDSGEEAYSLLNLMTVWEWVEAVSGVQIGECLYRLATEDGALVSVGLDAASGFACSVVKTDGDEVFAVRAAQRPSPTGEEVFTPSVLALE